MNLLKVFIKKTILQNESLNDLKPFAHPAGRGKQIFFIHMTNYPKLEISSNSLWQEGLYTYPLTHDIFDELLRINKEKLDLDNSLIGQGASRRFVLLLKAKNPKSIIGTFNYDQKKLTKDLALTKTCFHLSSLKFTAALDKIQENSFSFNDEPIGIIFSLYQMFDRVKDIKKCLGYSGIVDNGLGFINSADPTQAIFFDVNDLELLSIIDLWKNGRRSQNK